MLDTAVSIRVAAVAKRPANSSLNIDKICNTFNIKKKKWDMELKKIIKGERI